MRKLTMVTKTVLKLGQKVINSFTLIGEDYAILNCSEEELLKELKAGKIEVTNLGIGPKGIVSTNGAMDKYTTLDGATGTLLGKASPVILNRVEKDEKLVGYTIFNTSGVLQEVTVQTAVKIHGATPFSNGKIRHTQSGDIISSIVGNYPLRLLKIEDKKDGELKLDLIFVGSSVGEKSKLTKYAGVMVDCSNASKLSSIYKYLTEFNSKLVTELLASGNPEEVKESLAVRRTATAGFYAVIPLELLARLIKEANGKVANAVGKVIVSTVNYKGDYVEESVYELDKKLNVVNKRLEEGVTTSLIPNYVAEVVKMLKGVEIK